MSRIKTSIVTPWSLLFLVLAVSVVFLWPTWVSLHGHWLDSTRYSHGYLVAAISVYLLYRRRQALELGTAQPAFIALLPLLGLMILWLFAAIASIQVIQQIILPLIVWTMFLVVLGWPLASKVLLPVAYLYLAIPIWEVGNFILQWLTVEAVGILLWLFQVPAYIEGNLVSLPAGAFEIAGGCTGLHYLIIALAISVLYGVLYVERLRNRLLLITVAVVVALLTNWLRVFIVIFAGHLTDMQHYLVTQDHYYFGWMLFIIGLMPFFLFARRIEKSEENTDVAVIEHPAPVRTTPDVRPLVALGCCLVCLVISTGTVYAKLPRDGAGTLNVELPAPQGAWTLLSTDNAGLRPYFKGASGEVFGSYRGPSGIVDAYVNVYTGQTQGRELVGQENRVEGHDGWIRTGSKVRQVKLTTTDHSISVQEIGLRTTVGKRRIVYLWYDVGGTHLSGDLEAKIVFGVNLLRGKRDAGVVILSAECEHDCGLARERLLDWMLAHMPG